ncbi:MAG TPA: fused MFS/spermidine synthase [Pirellulales bacterium]|jgi:SAM-dependent methyltransferase|nr:fused MFS/spermidine synthase [Pirellulales bacterium]
MLAPADSAPTTGLKSRAAERLLVITYGLTTLLSALLLFEVQPIISKAILPWFGGSPAVWTTCMVFFETLLFGGYAYAHLSEKYLRPRWQVAVHLSLLAAAVAMLPIAPDAGWKAHLDAAPTWRILCLLTVTVGLPYFVLSATGPLVQAWFCRSFAGRSPYRLYALSNFGSLVALVGYPFYVEPRFAVGHQTWLWGLGFVAFALLCGAGAVWAALASRTSRPAAAVDALAAGQVAPQAGCGPTWRDRLAWLGLPALASMMLLATTNHVCQDVAVIPFLWVAPLALYLLSFIICFDHPAWYWRRSYAAVALASLLGVIVVDQLITGGSGLAFTFWQELTLHFAALFFLCMVCHGELVRRRPDPQFLTGFYLAIAGGGALGGIFVSLLAPQLFSTFFEWRLGLVIGCLAAAWVLLDGRTESFFHRRFGQVAAAALLIFVGLSCAPQFNASGGQALFTSARNFFGVVSVVERNVDDPAAHTMNFYSGRIVHGLQFLDPAKRHEPTAYYGRPAGVGEAFARLANRKNLKVGAVGLGVGTIAAYARPGDEFRFYELNPDVLDAAQKHFSYLADCQGKYDVVLGDARLSLDREQPQHFDLLVLDAFSGDAVPAHLLTAEAFEIYERHLKPDGVIAVHISNRYLDLRPVLAGLARRFGYSVREVQSAGDPNLGQFSARWLLLTRDAAGAKQADDGAAERAILWTDEHSNLFEILK